MSIYKGHMIQFVGLESDGLAKFLITKRGSQIILATSTAVTEAISLIDDICRQQTFGFEESTEDSVRRLDQMQEDFNRINSGNGHQEVKMPAKERIADPT